MEWQDIATAPKDGTRFLAYQKGEPIQECWWCEDFPEWQGWQNDNDWDSDPDPTHWMPLPAPPTLPPNEGGER